MRSRLSSSHPPRTPAPLDYQPQNTALVQPSTHHTCFCWDVTTCLPVAARGSRDPSTLRRDRRSLPGPHLGRHQRVGWGTLPPSQPASPSPARDASGSSLKR